MGVIKQFFYLEQKQVGAGGRLKLKTAEFCVIKLTEEATCHCIMQVGCLKCKTWLHGFNAIKQVLNQKSHHMAFV